MTSLLASVAVRSVVIGELMVLQGRSFPNPAHYWAKLNEMSLDELTFLRDVILEHYDKELTEL